MKQASLTFFTIGLLAIVVGCGSPQPKPKPVPPQPSVTVQDPGQIVINLKVEGSISQVASTRSGLRPSQNKSVSSSAPK